MTRVWLWTTTGALAFAAACGANPGTDTGDASRDVAAQDGPRRDVASVEGGSLPDGGADLDTGTLADGAADLDGAAPTDGTPGRDSGALTDVVTVGDSADASSLTCTAPSADCNHLASDGCEANLTSDAANCGACGRSCGTAACTAGQCGPEILLSGLMPPVNDIALDATNVYWFSAPIVMMTTAGQILSIPKAGGARTTVVGGLGYGEAGMQYHDGYLYYGTDRSGALVMERVAVTGGARTILTHWTPNYGTYAVGTTRFYATDHCFGGDPICTTGRESIVRLPNDGTGTGTVVLANRPGALVFGVDGTYVYFSDISDPSHVSINRLPAAGGPVEVLATNQTAGYVPTLGPDGYIYWSNGCTRTTPADVMRIAPGMASPQRLVTDIGCAEDVLSDGADVYWNSTNLATTHYYIRHLHLGASVADTMLDTTTQAGNIRIDATHVYYVSGTSEDSIRRIRR